jgi:hypothetical protein
MTYLTALRLIHISCGIFWAGATMYLAWFILPAVKSLGPEGGKFMQQLSKTNKLPQVMLSMGTLTVLSGILLIHILSGGFQSPWFGTSHGITISIGGTFAIIAYIMGLTINLPSVRKMGQIGAAIASTGGIPSQEQAQQMQSLRKKIYTATSVMALFLLVAVIGMAIFRYI